MVPRHQDGHTAPTLLAAVGCELQRFGANPTQCPVALHGSPGFVPSLFVPTHCAFPFFPPFSLCPLHPLLIAASNSHTHSSLLTRPFGISTWHLQSSSFWKRGEKKKEKKKERKRKTTLLKKNIYIIVIIFQIKPTLRGAAAPRGTMQCCRATLMGTHAGAESGAVISQCSAAWSSSASAEGSAAPRAGGSLALFSSHAPACTVLGSRLGASLSHLHGCTDSL